MTRRQRALTAAATKEQPCMLCRRQDGVAIHDRKIGMVCNACTRSYRSFTRAHPGSPTDVRSYR